MTPNEVLFHYSQYNSVHTLEIQNHFKTKPAHVVPNSQTESRGIMETRSETESERREREPSVVSSEANQGIIPSSSFGVIHTRIDQYRVYDDIIRDRHRSLFSNR